jgi:hypothetical protein
MKLKEFFLTEKENNPKNVSDKGTWHDYIEGYYDEVFSPVKDKDFSLLEIGIYRGDSINLWRKYFTKANIFAIDYDPARQDQVNYINTLEKTKAFLLNAYCDDTLNLFDDDSLDYIIDDGPHTLESQIFAAKFWTKKLKTNGKLIIEDIQNPERDCFQILSSISDQKNLCARIIDLRHNKNRYLPDDFIVEVTKK